MWAIFPQIVVGLDAASWLSSGSTISETTAEFTIPSALGERLPGSYAACLLSKVNWVL